MGIPFDIMVFLEDMSSLMKKMINCYQVKVLPLLFPVRMGNDLKQLLDVYVKMNLMVGHMLDLLLLVK